MKSKSTPDFDLEGIPEGKKRYKITGKTYEIKDTLKRLGYRWHGVNKYWYIDTDLGREDFRISWFKGNTEVGFAEVLK